MEFNIWWSFKKIWVLKPFFVLVLLIRNPSIGNIILVDLVEFRIYFICILFLQMEFSIWWSFKKIWVLEPFKVLVLLIRNPSIGNIILVDLAEFRIYFICILFLQMEFNIWWSFKKIWVLKPFFVLVLLIRTIGNNNLVDLAEFRIYFICNYFLTRPTRL